MQYRVAGAISHLKLSIMYDIVFENISPTAKRSVRQSFERTLVNISLFPNMLSCYHDNLNDAVCVLCLLNYGYKREDVWLAAILHKKVVPHPSRKLGRNRDGERSLHFPATH
jgi:hypothetical protein